MANVRSVMCDKLVIVFLCLCCLVTCEGATRRQDPRWRSRPLQKYCWYPDSELTIHWSFDTSFLSSDAILPVTLIQDKTQSKVERVQYILLYSIIQINTTATQTLDIVSRHFEGRLTAWYQSASIYCTFRNLTRENTGKFLLHLDHEFPLTDTTQIEIYNESEPPGTPGPPLDSESAWHVPVIIALCVLCITLASATICLFIKRNPQPRK